MSKKFVLGLIGNPNSGKSTLFNALTGARQKVGNWSGVTVDKKTGRFNHGETQFELVDLPGTYSLHVSHDDDSLDQQIAQNFILENTADVLVNIIDASSLERGLYLTTQLLDAGVPVIIALNMMDVAHQQGVHIDPCELANAIGVPVVPIVASRKEGIGALVDVIINRLDTEPSATPATAHLGDEIESAIAAISAQMQALKVPGCRLHATAILEQDDGILSHLPEGSKTQFLNIIRALEQRTGTKAADLLIEARYHWIARITKKVLHRDAGRRKTLTERLDDIFLNRLLAFPLFLGVMYLMFMFAINFGSAFIDFFDITAGALFIELPRQWLTALHLPEWLITLLADGAGGGIQLVAGFIPVIGALFLFQSFLEGSGYMARAAFIVDRIMRAIGLPGKSFVPLIVGFGCNVPAVMSARTLESHNDRLLTTLMAPFMSCGARLTVYILFATVFFPAQAQNVVFALYVLGMLLAVGTGFLVKRKLMNRDMTPFIMELPNYHIPTIKGVLMSTWHRLRGFMLRAGKAIVGVVIALSFVNSLGTDGTFGNENSEKSVLSVIGMKITPLFTPMGVQEENWPATVGIFSGIFAKEVVVGTLDALYTSMVSQDQQEEQVATTWQLISAGLATIPENLAGLSDLLTDPLGIGVGDLSDQAASAEEQHVKLTTLSLMNQLFGSAVAAFAYILFVLLYMPCVATLGAIYKEAGGFWAFFSAAWNTLIAYSAAVLCYQLGTFSEHPQSSLMWSALMIAICVGGYLGLMGMAKRRIKPPENMIPLVNIRT